MNWLYNFFHGFAVCLTGSSIAVILIAKFVYMPSVMRDEEDEPLPFEWNFLEELETLPERELSPEDRIKLGEKEVDVETPSGRVLMTYDEEAKSFAYYTDSKDVPFKYLDAVARQFAVEHDASQLCVNYGHDYVVGEASERPPAERSSVFVKLKARPTKEKRIKITNRFSHRGTIDQKWTVVEDTNLITFGEYKKRMCSTQRAVTKIPG